MNEKSIEKKLVEAVKEMGGLAPIATCANRVSIQNKKTIHGNLPRTPVKEHREQLPGFDWQCELAAYEGSLSSLTTSFRWD